MPKPVCSLCGHEKVKDIDSLLMSEGVSAASKHFGIHISSLYRHKKHVERRLENPVIAENTDVPALEAETDLARAVAYRKRVQARLEKAEARGDNSRVIDKLSLTYERAMRLEAKLNGALELTTRQIVKSRAWLKLWALMFEVLDKYPAVAQELTAVLEQVEKDE